MAKKNLKAAAEGFGKNPASAAMYNDTDTEQTDELFAKLANVKKGKSGGAIVPADSGALQMGGWQLTAIGLVPPADLAKHEYRQFGAALFRLDSAMQWLLGDYINIGDNFQWGETYQQLAEATGKEVKTLQNYASVARAVKTSLRREELTFGHHMLVMAMGAKDQTHWLNRAADEGLSIAKLRAAIKEAAIPNRADALEAHAGYQREALHVTTEQQIEHFEHGRAENNISTAPPQDTPTQTAQSLSTVHEPSQHGGGADFNYEAFREAQKQWDAAREAFNDVREKHMLSTRGQTVGRTYRKEAAQHIRNLIAHLHYVESQLEDK